MAKYAVIGLGKFGMTVATTLYENGAEVIAIDNDPELIEEVRDKVSNPVQMNSTNEKGLKNQGIQDVDAVILAIGNNIEVSVLTSAILKKIGVTNIYAKVDSKIHARILELIGVQRIIFPEEHMGVQLANTLMSRTVLQYFKLATGHSVVEMTAPENWVGKTLQELALPTERGVNIVAIKYEEESVTEEGDSVIEKKINDLPGANDTVNKNDVLVLIGPETKIKQLIKSTSKEE